MKILLAILVVMLNTPLLFAQTNDKGKKFPANKEEKAKVEEAEMLVVENDYERAFEIYKSLDESNPGHVEVLFPMAVCAQNLENSNDMALAYFEKINQAEVEGSDFPYYYALSLHKAYRFQEAIDQMNKFLQTSKPNKDQKIIADKTIEYCQNGLVLVANPAKVDITTLGDPLNTNGSEYAPMISADEKTILYTYRGDKATGGLQPVQGTNKKEYYEDVQIAYKDSAGLWFEPLLLQSNINTNGNDACVGVSPDAQYMYLFRSIDGDEGSLYMSELDGYTWTDPELLKGDINSKWWEGSITISHDGRKVYFASERPGGLGGRDIYEAKKNSNGTWGNVKNLGTLVNTTKDDDAPFLHPSGKYLVFSSQGHNTMGGFDIFVSELKTDSTWDVPKNIGYPINSPVDDKFYTVTADGLHGYYSSDKKGGLGKQDIYKVAPGIDKNVVLAQVVGDVYLDDIPTYAEIEVMDDSQPTLKTKYNSNSISGKFLIALPPGKTYKLKFLIGGLSSQTFDVDAKNITGFVEKYLLVKFYTDGETILKEVSKDSIKYENYAVKNTAKNIVRDSIPTILKDTVKVKDNSITVENNNSTDKNGTTESVIKPMAMAEFIEYSNPDLLFRVQVGAYHYPQNFRVEKFERDEKSVREMLTDGITRFTIKKFSTLKEAYAYRDEMIKLGVSDAFVTAVYKNKRYLLSEVREVLAKSIK